MFSSVTNRVLSKRIHAEIQNQIQHAYYSRVLGVVNVVTIIFDDHYLMLYHGIWCGAGQHSEYGECACACSGTCTSFIPCF